MQLTKIGLSLLLMSGCCGAMSPVGAQAPSSFAPDVQAEAIWDGRKIVPFHALDNPKMVTAALADFLDEDDYVLGMTINGEARAYPTRFVWWHHFINDHTDKAGAAYPAFVVTYCSVCNTGVRFDSRVDGKPLLFDFYGLYNGVAIMSDRDTESVWLLVEGRAIKGPRANKQLHTAPLLDTTWGEWKKLHPDTLVMSPDTEYKRGYSPKGKPESRDYQKFPAPFFEPTLTLRDKRLPPFDKVLAVRLPLSETKAAKNPLASDQTQAGNKPADNAGAGQAADAPEKYLCRAYPIAALKAAKGVVNDTLGNMPVAVFLNPATVTANAVGRTVDGKTLTFETREEDGKTVVVDKETGSRWNIEGVAESGPLMGKSLPRLDCHLSQWYGWVAYYPETSIFGRADAPQTEKIRVSP